MNVKTFFIAAILSLVCVPLYTQAENVDMGQLCYEEGMNYWNKAEDSDGALRKRYETKAMAQFKTGADRYDNPECMIMLGRYYIEQGNKNKWGKIADYYSAINYFRCAEICYDALLSDASDDKKSELESKLEEIMSWIDTTEELIEFAKENMSFEIRSGLY